MTLTDRRFGSEIVTTKGKVFEFDDLNCLAGYLKSGGILPENIARIVSIDFKKAGSFLDVQQAFFLKSEALKSPMRGDVATFSDQQDRDAVKTAIGGGQEMTWEDVKTGF